MTYRPATNWNGYNPARYTTGAQRALAASAGPSQGTARRGPLPAPSTPALPSWLPVCDE